MFKMSDSDETTWIHWFCKQRGHEFFCEVDEDYIQDKFNLNFLDSDVDHFRRSLEVILDLDNEPDSENPQELADIDRNAERLYGLIHARYILTNRGIDVMLDKFRKGVFGFCPRVYCQRQPVLPIGITDAPAEETVRIYCPKCNDIYLPRSVRHSHIDGAYFGTGFPHMLLMVNPDVRPKRSKQKFVPRLYGFKIHHSAQRQLQDAVNSKENPQEANDS